MTRVHTEEVVGWWFEFEFEFGWPTLFELNRLTGDYERGSSGLDWQVLGYFLPVEERCRMTLAFSRFGFFVNSESRIRVGYLIV